MARQLSTSTVQREERTFRVEREAAKGQEPKLIIHRERLSTDEDGEVTRKARTFAFVGTFSDIKKRPAASKYLAAVNAAQSLDDCLAAEQALYDDLVSEADVEKAAAEQAKADAEAARVAKIEADKATK